MGKLHKKFIRRCLCWSGCQYEESIACSTEEHPKERQGYLGDVLLIWRNNRINCYNWSDSCRRMGGTGCGKNTYLLSLDKVSGCLPIVTNLEPQHLARSEKSVDTFLE